MKKIRKLLLTLCILCLFFGFSSQADGTEKRVLFISSYSCSQPLVELQMQGIKDGLGVDVTLDCEFMDTKRVDTKESEQLFYERLKYTLSVTKPYDAIILGDDAALRFALKYQDELFAGMPMFFEGVNDEELARKAAKNPMISGVIEKLSVEKNIELGLSICPDAKRVVAILDNSITGEIERKNFFKYAEKYQNLEFDEINTSELKSVSLRYELGRLSEDTILIYILMTEDAEGNRYTNRQALQIVAENSKVPVLCMVDGNVGDGLLGGNVVSMYKSGQIAAQMVESVFRGVSVEDIEMVEDSPQVYYIDESVMERFKLDKDDFPEKTQYVNRTETFFEKNKEALVPGCILLLALIAVSGWSMIDNLRCRKLMKELEGARKIMESASQHDFLTGIPNRNKFMSDLVGLIEQKKPCTIFMIDIDDFKSINDTLGHTAGDEALIQVASRLKDMSTQLLTPYRFAGDEFILISESVQGKIIEKTAFACKEVFSKEVVLAGNKSKVFGSIGIASYPKDADTLEQLIINADAAMYKVKKNGKNDFAFYCAEE